MPGSGVGPLDDDMITMTISRSKFIELSRLVYFVECLKICELEKWSSYSIAEKIYNGGLEDMDKITNTIIEAAKEN